MSVSARESIPFLQVLDQGDYLASEVERHTYHQLTTLLHRSKQLCVLLKQTFLVVKPAFLGFSCGSYINHFLSIFSSYDRMINDIFFCQAFPIDWTLLFLRLHLHTRKRLTVKSLKAPVPARSPKLSSDEPVQYLGGWPFK